MEGTASPSKAGRTIGVLIVIALIVLVVILDMRRRAAEQKLMQLSMQYQQDGNQAQNQQAAKMIVDKVRRLYDIPADVDPTVATIVDVNQLRARNAFYNKAKNGDNLIVTNDRAILYDPDADKIIDVVPVQIQPATAQSSSGKAKSAASAPAAAPSSAAAQ